MTFSPDAPDPAVIRLFEELGYPGACKWGYWTLLKRVTELPVIAAGRKLSAEGAETYRKLTQLNGG